MYNLCTRLFGRPMCVLVRMSHAAWWFQAYASEVAFPVDGYLIAKVDRLSGALFIVIIFEQPYADWGMTVAMHVLTSFVQACRQEMIGAWHD